MSCSQHNAASSTERNLTCASLLFLVLAAVGCTSETNDAPSSSTSPDGGTATDAGDEEEPAATEAALPSTFNWTSTPPLIAPVPDATHPILSVKDPSVVFFDGKWHVFATTADENAQWNMVYLSFDDWSEAPDAELHFLDENPALRGYHAAPQVFYFAPQEKWYLVFQSQQPQYSTTDDLSKPETWSTPQNFFTSEPTIVTENKGEGTWLDYWVICDDDQCHLFFTDDNGHLYRSETSIDDFPAGFGDPVIAIDGTKSTLFEGSATYKVGDNGGYLTLVEAFGSVGERYYRSFVSDTLRGEWTPLAASLDNPFAARGNVAFPDGTAWTMDISHGELIRDGHDQSLTIDPGNLRFLYQGVDPSMTGVEYFQLPYQLALLTYTETPPATPDPVEDGPSVCEAAALPAMATISDFDDGSIARWWSSYDDTSSASHEPMAAEPPGANGSAAALHFRGTGYMSWGANFGITPGCTDTSAFAGLSFYAKGSSGVADELHVIAQVAAALPASAGGDCTADCYSHPRTTITLTPEWVRYDLPFDGFLHPGWGVTTAYEGVVMGFVFESSGPDFDVWVDELTLFSEGSLDGAADAGPSNVDAGPAGGDAGTPIDAGKGVETDAGFVDAGSAEAGPGDAGAL